MANYKKHTSSLKVQNPATSLDAIYFKSMMDGLTVELQLSMEPLNDALIALKSELKLSTERMTVTVESCELKVDQINDVTDIRLGAMNAEIKVLYRIVNRSKFNIKGLPEGINDIPGTVIETAEHCSAPIALHNINFAGYTENNITIMVKLNSFGMRDILMGKYFKNLKIHPLYAVNCVDDAKFTQGILQRRCVELVPMESGDWKVRQKNINERPMQRLEWFMNNSPEIHIEFIHENVAGTLRSIYSNSTYLPQCIKFRQAHAPLMP
uniref:Uncharacterized protein n=1 Tax=Glossina palpalis gambiensis TaxID=67801 RepID=A0A1B0ASI4_9MUSC